MQVRTWFGTFTLEDEKIVGVELSRKNIDTILEHLAGEPLLLRGKVAGVDLCDLAIRYGFVTSKSEYDSLLHDLSIEFARKQVARAVATDTRIIAAVEVIDDIDETANILAERLKEWYILDSSETNLKGEELARHITRLGGIDPEIRTMQSFAEALLGLYNTRLLAEEYLEQNMPVIAPNLTGIAGHILGARLLSIAGSLERLASMPSGTVQVIGAGNALFKHLKGKAPSPKHGVIFRHPFVNTAPKKIRGKIARAVASKISLAARYDYYSGELKEGLKEDLDNKVQGIKKTHFKRKSSG